MADTYSAKVRSQVMSRIRKTNTKPEMVVRSFLFKNGFRYRVHVKDLPGNPDIVLPKYKIIIFVNGCFWHAHEGCKLNRMPKSRPEYWIPKIKGNVARDKIHQEALIHSSWNVIYIWECELRKNKVDDTLDNLVKAIRNTHDHSISGKRPKKAVNRFAAKQDQARCQ